MDFTEINTLRQQLEKQKQLLKSYSTQTPKLNVLINKQCELNNAFSAELQRLKDEFSHFKLHTISQINGNGKSVVPCLTPSYHCVTNPFHLYQVSTNNKI